MGFSLDVFVMGQIQGQVYKKTSSFCAEQQYELTDEDILEAQNELKKSGKVIDKVTYPFYENIVGKWYTLGKEEDGEVWWALGLIDTDFDRHLSVNASWIGNEVNLECFTPVIVKEDYQEDLEKLLEDMLESSPTKTMIILPRYQGGDTEVIQESIPFKKYIQLIKEEKIPFNVYTIIQNL